MANFFGRECDEGASGSSSHASDKTLVRVRERIYLKKHKKKYKKEKIAKKPYACAAIVETIKSKLLINGFP